VRVDLPQRVVGEAQAEPGLRGPGPKSPALAGQRLAPASLPGDVARRLGLRLPEALATVVAQHRRGRRRRRGRCGRCQQPLQSLRVRERRGLGGRGDAGGDGALLQLPEPPGELQRAHAHLASLPPAGGRLPDKLLPALAAPHQRLPGQVRADAGCRVPGRVVPHPLERRLPQGADGRLRPGPHRRQGQVVRPEPRAHQLPRMGLGQFPGQRHEGHAPDGEPADRRERLRHRGRREHQLLLLLPERLRLGDGELRPLAKLVTLFGFFLLASEWP
jgi:hypothetical protein